MTVVLTILAGAGKEGEGFRSGGGGLRIIDIDLSQFPALAPWVTRPFQKHQCASARGCISRFGDAATELGLSFRVELPDLVTLANFGSSRVGPSGWQTATTTASAARPVPLCLQATSLKNRL